MSCLSCASNYRAEFAAELIIHFSGLENLDKPGVSAFPRLSVCLDCGYSHFIVQESELPLLASGVAAHEALTLERCVEGLGRRGRIALRKGA
jgi:hypothetical protein